MSLLYITNALFELHVWELLVLTVSGGLVICSGSVMMHGLHRAWCLFVLLKDNQILVSLIWVNDQSLTFLAVQVHKFSDPYEVELFMRVARIRMTSESDSDLNPDNIILAETILKVDPPTFCWDMEEVAVRMHLLHTWVSDRCCFEEGKVDWLWSKMQRLCLIWSESISLKPSRDFLLCPRA